MTQFTNNDQGPYVIDDLPIREHLRQLASASPERLARYMAQSDICPMYASDYMAREAVSACVVPGDCEYFDALRRTTHPSSHSIPLNFDITPEED
jgi:hypothetical protein